MSMTTLAHPHTSTSELNVRGTNGYAVVAVTSASVAAGIVLLPNIPLASIGLFLLAAFLFKVVSNLLVVLCAESEAQPVINTGTLYT